MYSGPQFKETEASAHLQVVATPPHPKQTTPHTCSAGKHSHSTDILHSSTLAL
jgi:hypothetical protein